MIKTCPKHAPAMSKSLPWILGRRTTKEDQGLTVHVRLELERRVMPSGHLVLQVLGLLLELANLRDLRIILSPELTI